jgi:hypothetical protein
MRPRSRTPLAIATILALFGILTLAGGVLAAPTTLSTTLQGGAAEVPPGDPDGSGSATVVLDPAAGTACWNFTTMNVGPGTQSHIHEGAAGVAGPVVVPFDVDGFGESSEGCSTGQDAALLQRIIDNPAAFYVNVHTEAHPPGAVRGQLAASAVPSTAMGGSNVPTLVTLGVLVLLAGIGLGIRSLRVESRTA